MCSICRTLQRQLEVIKAGKLTLVVSGPQPAYEAARPYLDMMGVGSSYVGDGELSRIVKICHNVMLAWSPSRSASHDPRQKAGVPGMPSSIS